MRFETNLSRMLGATLMGTAAFIYILFKSCPSYFSLLFLIPFTYSILNIVCGIVHSDDNTFNTFGIMFNGIMFLRAVILPVLLAAGGYATSKTVNIEHNMPLAIMLFCYEMLIEYLFVYIMSRKHQFSYLEESNNDFNTSTAYYPLLIALTIGLLICFALAPMAVGYYRTVFGINNYEFTGFSSGKLISQYATSIPRKFGLVTFRYIANVSRLVIPGVVLVLLKRRHASKGLARAVVLLCIFVANFLLMDDTIATSLVNSLITLLFYNKLFSTPEKIIGYFVVAVIVIMAYFGLRMFLVSTVKNTYGLSALSRISNYLQAYFCGITNISAGLNLHTDSIFETYKYMIYEFLKGIPYATTIFGLDSTNISTLYNSLNNCTGQIVPTIASGTLYFSWILAPFFSCIFIYISFRAAKSIQNNDKPLNALGSLAISIYALMGVSMYSPEATWSFIFCIGVPIKLLSKVFERHGDDYQSVED